MTADGDDQRHSVALDADLIADPQLKAEAEARNGLRQFDLALKLIEEGLERGADYRLRVSKILDLHRCALQGISAYAGNFRPAGVAIQGSNHQPVGAHLVPQLVEEMCDYVNENWKQKSPIHLSAYIMWRLNWIHPFADGNGRTSRVVSYMVLCIRLGSLLNGELTIPEQIVANRKPYFEALDAADAAWKEDRLDLSAMEALLSAMLSTQLLRFYEAATGCSPSEHKS